LAKTYSVSTIEEQPGPRRTANVWFRLSSGNFRPDFWAQPLAASPVRGADRAGPFDELGATRPVRVRSHRQTRKESHPVAGFRVMKTGKTLAKPAGDRNIFSLSDGGENLPRLPKGRRISGQVSFVTNRTATLPARVHSGPG
jgi:hypothetical protein